MRNTRSGGHGWLALLVVTLVAPGAVFALGVEHIPNPRLIKGNWVSDVANILRLETEQKLNTQIDQLKAANGSEMAVVTVPDSKPESSTKQLATKLFNRWGIGQKGKNNGILFLISVGDRRVEIETGKGMQATLPNAKVGAIIRERITPQFKTGNFDAGTLSGTEAIVQVVQGKEIEHPSQPWGFNPVVVALFGWIGITMALRASTGEAPWAQDDLTRLKALVGVAFVRGLGQSVKLQPTQSSRVQLWHLFFETAGSMRCARCGDLLDPVEQKTVEGMLQPQQKAAETLGSLQFRGWRCRRCAPQQWHLRGYESPSYRFDRCPHCQERTVLKEAPYVVRNPIPPDVRITNSRCVHCDYNAQVKKIETPWLQLGSSDGEGSSGDGFGGGSSDGGGAGGSW